MKIKVKQNYAILIYEIYRRFDGEIEGDFAFCVNYDKLKHLPVSHYLIEEILTNKAVDSWTEIELND